MWRVYLVQFIITAVISCIWVYLIDKSKDVPRDENEPFP